MTVPPILLLALDISASPSCGTATAQAPPFLLLATMCVCMLAKFEPRLEHTEHLYVCQLVGMPPVKPSEPENFRFIRNRSRIATRCMNFNLISRFWNLLHS